MNGKGFGLILLLVFLTSCAYIDQNLTLAPTLDVAKTDIGKGKTLGVEIIDDRDSQTIGRRADGYGFNAAKIQSKQDVIEVVREPIMGGLSSSGFNPVLDNNVLPRLRVEIRTLSYEASAGLWTAGNLGQCALKVIATNKDNQRLEKTYRGQQEVRTAFVSSQENNANLVNGALSQALSKIFVDNDLLDFLAK